jgi:hypothetical protein
MVRASRHDYLRHRIFHLAAVFRLIPKRLASALKLS